MKNTHKTTTPTAINKHTTTPIEIIGTALLLSAILSTNSFAAENQQNGLYKIRNVDEVVKDIRPNRKIEHARQYGKKITPAEKQLLDTASITKKYDITNLVNEKGWQGKTGTEIFTNYYELLKQIIKHNPEYYHLLVPNQVDTEQYTDNITIKPVTYNVIIQPKEIEDLVINEITSRIPKGLSDEEISLWIRTYIRNNIVYDYEVSDGGAIIKKGKEADYLNSELIWNILQNKKGTCYGYSALYANIMNRIGIPATIIVDDNLNHAYNEVLLNNKWQKVDITADVIDVREVISPIIQTQTTTKPPTKHQDTEQDTEPIREPVKEYYNPETYKKIMNANKKPNKKPNNDDYDIQIYSKIYAWSDGFYYLDPNQSKMVFSQTGELYRYNTINKSLELISNNIMVGGNYGDMAVEIVKDKEVNLYTPIRHTKDNKIKIPLSIFNTTTTDNLKIFKLQRDKNIIEITYLNNKLNTLQKERIEIQNQFYWDN